MRDVLNRYGEMRSKLFGDEAALRAHYHFGEEFMKKYNVPATYWCTEHDHTKPFKESNISFEQLAWKLAIEDIDTSSQGA